MVLGFTLAACASKGLDKDAEGEITIMTYNGDGQTYEDFGHAEIDPLEITNQNVGLLYAVAKNSMYIIQISRSMSISSKVILTTTQLKKHGTNTEATSNSKQVTKLTFGL